MTDQAADRAELRLNFLARAGWRCEAVVPMPADASFRRYYRLHGAPRPSLVMDAPPGLEDVTPFVTIARHLRAVGLSAPEILAADEELGFVLIEDFGDDTFTRLLNAGADPQPLYELAIDALAALHRCGDAAAVDVPSYLGERLVEAASLLPDWYLPARRGGELDPAASTEFVASLRDLITALPPVESTLALRDFHVDNLMLVAGRQGVGACGLLDFQDAGIGSRAYDVMSLLQDARRDLPPGLEPAMLARYHEAVGTGDVPVFTAWYNVLAAQRHCRVLGVFVRLWVRDGKPGYLAHIPRVARLLDNVLQTAELAPLKVWFDRYLPDLREPLAKPDRRPRYGAVATA